MRKADTHNYRNICLESFINYVDKQGKGFSQKSAYVDSKRVNEVWLWGGGCRESFLNPINLEFVNDPLWDPP